MWINFVCLSLLFVIDWIPSQVKAEREFAFGTSSLGSNSVAPNSLFSSSLLANRVKNADLLRSYLQELDKYVAIVSRPRFGRTSGLPSSLIASPPSTSSNNINVPSIRSNVLSSTLPASNPIFNYLTSLQSNDLKATSAPTNTYAFSTSGSPSSSASPNVFWPEITFGSALSAADYSFERQTFDKGFVAGVVYTLNYIKSQMQNKLQS